MTLFGQVASAYQSREGFALGLQLTKWLAEAVGGTFTEFVVEGTTAHYSTATQSSRVDAELARVGTVPSGFWRAVLSLTGD